MAARGDMSQLGFLARVGVTERRTQVGVAHLGLGELLEKRPRPGAEVRFLGRFFDDKCLGHLVPLVRFAHGPVAFPRSDNAFDRRPLAVARPET